MGRVNRKGRNKFEPFIRLHRGVTNSEAWKSLSCEARCLLIEIWARHNGSNNGQIPYSHREARKALHVGSRKVQAAFQEIEECGFLIPRAKGSFDWKQRQATEWEITTESCDDQPAKRLYREGLKKQNTAPTVGTDGTHGGHRGDPERPI